MDPRLRYGAWSRLGVAANGCRGFQYRPCQTRLDEIRPHDRRRPTAGEHKRDRNLVLLPDEIASQQNRELALANYATSPIYAQMAVENAAAKWGTSL